MHAKTHERKNAIYYQKLYFFKKKRSKFSCAKINMISFIDEQLPIYDYFHIFVIKYSSKKKSLLEK